MSFTVVVSSPTVVTYKWYFSGNAIHGYGNTTPTLTITNAQTADAGVYWVEVKNAGGKIMSSNATLTVVSVPPNVTSAGMTTNGFTFLLSGPTNSTCVILSSTNLRDWTPISTSAVPAGSVTFTDKTATNCSFRLYRAMLQ